MPQKLHVLLMSLLFIIIVPVIAQTDLDESYEWDDEGITVDYPDDWDSFVDDNDIVHLASDETDIFFIFEDNDPDDDIEEYIEDAVDTYSFDRVRFDADDVLIGDLEDFELSASYFYMDELGGEDFERAIVAIPLNDEVMAIAVIVPITDDEIEEIDMVFDILATLTITGSSGTSNENNYEFDNGYEIVLDNGWAVEADVFSNGDLDIVFEFFDLDDEREDSPADWMRAVYADESDIAYEEDFVYFMELANDDNAIGYYYEEDYYRIIISFSPDGDTVIIAVITPSDEDDTQAVFDHEDDIYEFLGTLE